jgi:hypothetical protein
MARQANGYCVRCKKDFTTVIPSDASIPDLCSDCQQKAQDEERKIYFLQLDKMPIENRLRRIEEWLYDYQPSIDIKQKF